VNYIKKSIFPQYFIAYYLGTTTPLWAWSGCPQHTVPASIPSAHSRPLWYYVFRNQISHCHEKNWM